MLPACNRCVHGSAAHTNDKAVNRTVGTGVACKPSRNRQDMPATTHLPPTGIATCQAKGCSYMSHCLDPKLRHTAATHAYPNPKAMRCYGASATGGEHKRCCRHGTAAQGHKDGSSLPCPYDWFDTMLSASCTKPSPAASTRHHSKEGRARQLLAVALAQPQLIPYDPAAAQSRWVCQHASQACNV